jgi:hypothetical protein
MPVFKGWGKKREKGGTKRRKAQKINKLKGKYKLLITFSKTGKNGRFSD